MATLRESMTQGTSWNDFKAVTWLGQTFTPSENFLVYSVKLNLYRIGSGIGTLTLGIRAVDGENKPVAPDLDSGTMAADGVTTNTSGAWYEILIGGAILLVSGTRYGITARTSGGDSNNFLQGHYSGTDYYADGQGFRSGDSGSTWSTHGQDWNFEVWGNTPPDLSSL